MTSGGPRETFAVRLLWTERSLLEAAAAQAGEFVSEYIRRVALEAARQDVADDATAAGEELTEKGALLLAAQALESMRHINDGKPQDCWCEAAVDNPMMQGRHSAQCVAARRALTAARRIVGVDL